MYWAGGLPSNLGTWLHIVAASVVVYALTGSALAVGILGFGGFLPILLFSVHGGLLADRYDRRAVVVWCSVASIVASSLLTILTAAGLANEVHIIAATFALNTAYALSKPSYIALIPSLVPRDELTDAVGLNALQFILGQIIGPILATLILATAGAAWAFGINGISFVGPILAMGFLYRAGIGGGVEGSRSAAGPEPRPVSSGVAFVRGHPWVLALLVGVVATAVPLEFLRTLSPALVSEALGEPERSAGIVVAAQSVGSAIALMVFVPLRRRGWSRPIAAVGMILQGVGLVGAALAPTLVTMSFAVAFVGFGFSLCFPVLTGVLQGETPDDVRGRVMSYHQVAHLGNRPFAAIVIGALAALFGAQYALFGGLVMIPIGLLAIRLAWRRLSDQGDRDAPLSEAVVDPATPVRAEGR